MLYTLLLFFFFHYSKFRALKLLFPSLLCRQFLDSLFPFLAGPQVVGDLFLEVLRAFYSYCKDTLGSDLQLSYNQSGNTLARYGKFPALS